MNFQHYLWEGATLALLSSAAALAQYPAPVTGRALDYSFRPGGTDYYSRPTSPLLLGNSSATGNLRGGLSFRGYEPITDPTAFRAPVGSSALSSFLRDSVSPTDSYAGNYFDARQLYFDPSRTAPTAAFLQRSPNSIYGNVNSSYGYGNAPGAWGGAVQPPSMPSLRNVNVAGANDPRAGLTSPVNSLLDQRIAAGQSSELYSTIFGVGRGALPKPRGVTVPEKESPGRVATDDVSKSFAAGGQPLDFRPETGRFNVLDRPMDQLMRNESQRELAQRGILPRNTERGAAPPEANAAPAVRPTAPVSPFLVNGTKPGADMFTDMRLAFELRRNPNASWTRDMFGGEANVRPADDAVGFANRVLGNKIRSFARENSDPLNLELTQAEAALQSGDFYEAAAHYERAARIDPYNPLPMVGKGNALLAAGEYVSAAVYLLRGLERFPDLAKLDLDVTSLLGGGQIVDLRRAEIKRMLKTNEDARLRFLLGYIEYYSDDRKSGLENFDKAAETADPGSVMLRLPAMLRSTEKPAEPAQPTAPSEPARKPSPADN